MNFENNFKQNQFDKNEQESEVSGEEKEPISTTAKGALEKMGMTITEEQLGEIECEYEKELVKVKSENVKELEKLLDGYKFSSKEKEKIITNVEINLNSALDSEAEREFAKLRHHGKVIAASIGVGTIAGLASAGARMLGGGMAMKAGKIAGGVLLGAGAGALRAKVRSWFNPAIEKIKKKNSDKFEAIRKEKSLDIFSKDKNDSIKTVLVQEIRRAGLEKISMEYSAVSENKKNARKIIDNTDDFKNLSDKEKDILSKNIALLSEVMDQNSSLMVDHIEARNKGKKRMNQTAKSAMIGSVIGGAASAAQAYSDSPYMPAIASGAIGGIMMGHGIDDGWAKRDLRKKSEDSVDFVNRVDSLDDDAISGKQLSRVKSLVESGLLDKHQLSLEKAKNILSNQIIRYSRDFNREEIRNNNEKIEKNLKRSKWKTAASYAAGLGIGMGAGAGARYAFAEARNLISNPIAEDFDKQGEEFYKGGISDSDQPGMGEPKKADTDIFKGMKQENNNVATSPEDFDKQAEKYYQGGESDNEQSGTEQQEIKQSIYDARKEEQGRGEFSEAEEKVLNKAFNRETPLTAKDMPSSEIIEQATVRRGEGVSHAVMRQLIGGDIGNKDFQPSISHLRDMGYKGDIENKGTIENWARNQAGKIVTDEDYYNKAENKQTWVMKPNESAYVLHGDVKNGFHIAEAHDRNGDGKFEFTELETHPEETAEPYEKAHTILEEKQAEVKVELIDQIHENLSKVESIVGNDSYTSVDMERGDGTSLGVIDAGNDGQIDKVVLMQDGDSHQDETLRSISRRPNEAEDVFLDRAREEFSNVITASQEKFNNTIGDLEISPQEARDAGINIYDRTGISSEDKIKLDYWRNHPDLPANGPVSACEIFDITNDSEFTVNEKNLSQIHQTLDRINSSGFNQAQQSALKNMYFENLTGDDIDHQMRDLLGKEKYSPIRGFFGNHRGITLDGRGGFSIALDQTKVINGSFDQLKIHVDSAGQISMDGFAGWDEAPSNLNQESLDRITDKIYSYMGKEAPRAAGGHNVGPGMGPEAGGATRSAEAANEAAATKAGTVAEATKPEAISVETEQKTPEEEGGTERINKIKENAGEIIDRGDSSSTPIVNRG